MQPEKGVGSINRQPLRTGSGGLALWREFFDVGRQFLFIGQAGEVEADHFVGDKKVSG